MSRLQPTSIRTRLALWYGLAVAAAVLVYGTVVYAFFHSSLLAQLDARLRDDFEAAEHAFEAEPGGGLRWARDDDHEEGAHESAWVDIAGPDGALLLRRPDPSLRDALPYRTYERVYRVGGTEYLIRVGRSEKPVRHEIEELLLLLAACLLPVAGLAYFGGRLLAGRALAPVHEMTKRAQEITAERLSDRLPVASPGDELGRLATVFNDAFARIEGAFKRLRRFTADASHELRTPLSAQRSVGEIGLRDAKTAEELRDVVGSMLEESERLTRLVDGLLVLCRGDAGAASIRREPVRLGNLVREVVGQLGVLAEEKQQDLVIEDHIQGVVDADPVVLRQAVSNLLDNAIKYAPSGTAIRIVVREDASASSLAVTDQGPGIAPADQRHVFDRFYRADPARSRGGVGLGLAIAQWAVEAHGGRIDLESEMEKGSTFRIVLPKVVGTPASPSIE